jgi:hypothetical protein
MIRRMGEQWISAATALELASEVASKAWARDALLKRADAGMIKTRCQVLRVGGVQQDDDGSLPPRFWDENGVRIEENWAAGDFCRVLIHAPGEPRIEAFGVTFALRGVLNLLPVEKRSAVMRRLSVATNPDWISARDAHRLVLEKGGYAPTKAGAAIIAQAALGFVTARAVSYDLVARRRAGMAHFSWREHDVEIFFWRDFTQRDRSRQDWQFGAFRGTNETGVSTITLEGVHFLKESILAMLPEADPVEAPPPPGSGGRPPAGWWDDLWCHVWGLVYEGKLIPDTQADVERAMHDWAQARGHNPADSTIRLKARKLFKVLKEGVENPR